MPSSAYHGSVEQSQTGENTPGFDQPTTTPKPIAYKPPKVVPKSEITISTFDCTNKPDGVYADGRVIIRDGVLVVPKNTVLPPGTVV